MLQRIGDRLHTSLLLIPIGFSAGAVVLAGVVRRLDQLRLTRDIPLIFSVGADSARQILSTVAGATLTVAGIVFSVTLITVQLAASQYTPRLVQGFLHDRFQQSVVGLVAGTFIYCLLALSAVDSRAAEIAPRLSVSVAILLGLVTILAIISFIDRIGRRIQIDETMRRVADDTTRSIRHHLPDRDDVDELAQRNMPDGDPVTVRSSVTGWVHEIDLDRLLSRLPSDAVVRLEQHLGNRLVEGEAVATAWGAEERRAQEAVMAAFEVGRSRSVDEDPMFGLRQLVDIGLRAISPGINDPTTAGDVLRHLVEPVATALERPTERRVFRGDGNRRVYLPDAPTHAAFVRRAFEEIRIFGIGQPYVVGAMVEALDSIHHRLHGAGVGGRCAPLMTELELLRADVEHAPLPADTRTRLLEAIDESALVHAHRRDD